MQNENNVTYANQQNINSNFNNQASYFPLYSTQEYINQSYDSSLYSSKFNIISNNNNPSSQNVNNGSSLSALNGKFQIKKPLTESLTNQINKRDDSKKSNIAQIKSTKLNSKLESKKLDKQKSISESVSPLLNAYSFLSSNEEQGQSYITDNDEQSDDVENTDEEDEENEDGDDESESDESDGEDEEPREKKSNASWNKSALSAPWIQPGTQKK